MDVSSTGPRWQAGSPPSTSSPRHRPIWPIKSKSDRLRNKMRINGLKKRVFWKRVISSRTTYSGSRAHTVYSSILLHVNLFWSLANCRKKSRTTFSGSGVENVSTILNTNTQFKHINRFINTLILPIIIKI